MTGVETTNNRTERVWLFRHPAANLNGLYIGIYHVEPVWDTVMERWQAGSLIHSCVNVLSDELVFAFFSLRGYSIRNNNECHEFLITRPNSIPLVPGQKTFTSIAWQREVPKTVPGPVPGCGSAQPPWTPMVGWDGTNYFLLLRYCVWNGKTWSLLDPTVSRTPVDTVQPWYIPISKLYASAYAGDVRMVAGDLYPFRGDAKKHG